MFRRLVGALQLTAVISKILDLANEDTPQFYAACGTRARSSLRVLRHGLEVTEMAVSELPSNPNAVWTARRQAEGTCRKPVKSILLFSSELVVQ